MIVLFGDNVAINQEEAKRIFLSAYSSLTMKIKKKRNEKSQEISL